MKKNKKIKKVFILGSGGLRIGQAGEFDYSGSQAIKALKQEGIKVILMNPNIATVQTDSSMADEVYLYPLTLEFAKAVIQKEKPDAILLGFGGQTALNLGFLLEESGILDEYNVKVLGTNIKSIRDTEDRDTFKNALESIGIQSPQSICVTNVEDAITAARKLGYPIMLRSGFSLGGLGSGKVHNDNELVQRAQECFATCPQILIEEYLLGWKEFEYEIIRDAVGSALTICNMENMDPMGIHTGESIVVAPAQTLTNTQHQFLRNIAIKVAHHFNIVGECNIQFAINPKNGDYRVIEMNARLSRSSALASKATGYPLAYVAAKLTLGWLLHEIINSVTRKTCAFFEPALDYIVVKIPRWDTHKLKKASRGIGSEMKSVGEVMGIGRSFPEALQKAVGMLNIGATCLSDYPYTIENAKDEIENPTDRRLFALYQFFIQGGTQDEAHHLSKIDPWFLYYIKQITDIEKNTTNINLTKDNLRLLKQYGFSDHVIAKMYQQSESDIRQLRKKLDVLPVIKQIDTLAGEFEAETNYLYLTYHGIEHDISPSNEQPIIILGSGPYSIGSSVEFDWCAVNASRTLRKHEKKSIMINSNPETVSTDYDESDRLYFEQLTLERVQDIADFENPIGIIVSVGGQVANNLALPLSLSGYPLLGTSAENIDRAEDREKFSALLQSLHIEQPPWKKIAPSEFDEAKAFAMQYSYPILVRPSYILSGSAMNIAHDDCFLEKFLLQAFEASSKHPVVISKFIEDAKELEIDGVACEGKIIIDAINEHIENAGVHSGDATLVLPPQNLYLETIRQAKKITRKIVHALNITGPFNIQFIAKNNHLQVIECNLRSSRSLPFVSKITHYNFIQIFIEALLNLNKSKKQKHASFYETLELNYVGVKSPQFSYQRLKGADPVQHVEMASTGEVACLGENLQQAFWLAWFASEQNITEKSLLVSIADAYKAKFLPFLQILESLGWKIYSTEGTHAYLFKNGVASYFVYKSSEQNKPNIQSLITQRQVSLIINIPTNGMPNTQTDGYKIRRMAIDHHVPLIANAQKALLILECLINLNHQSLAVYSWREYVNSKEL